MDLAQILNDLGHRHARIDVRAKQYHQEDGQVDMYRIEVVEMNDTWCGTGSSWEQAFIDLLHKMREHVKTESVNRVTGSQFVMSNPNTKEPFDELNAMPFHQAEAACNEGERLE